MSVQQGHAAPTPARQPPAIRWIRVLLAGFLAEVALIVVAIPLYFMPNAQAALNLGIPPASFVVLVAFGYWAARGAPRSQVLNGFLAGLAGVALYLCLVFVGSAAAHRDPWAAMTPAYLLAHALKMAGGAAGGWLAARRSFAST
jgi:putative membrane protein (TIGR04086 family)